MVTPIQMLTIIIVAWFAFITFGIWFIGLVVDVISVIIVTVKKFFR